MTLNTEIVPMCVPTDLADQVANLHPVQSAYTFKIRRRAMCMSLAAEVVGTCVEGRRLREMNTQTGERIRRVPSTTSPVKGFDRCENKSTG